MSAGAAALEGPAAAGADASGVEAARRLALRYFVASTVILLASGLLGVLLRTSQADFGRVGDNTWYALMTAHGLGAFVGWAAFAVMGFAWWVLASVGLPPRRLGIALANATYWLMVVGVAGVLVTTLLMGFAASWVFLYPLPFASAGQWGDLAAGLFSASVLLVGLSIVTWCVGILHTVVGPGLHAVRTSVWNRLGVALGLGYLWPRRFPTNPSSVAYPVIPLTVIGIDMIIATLPLAALLAVMVAKSMAPGIEVDPLLAKNVLWFFGHPVVYLLLFPAVAILYLLVPRFAGRPLVAGNVIAVAWLVAVVANVVIWGHHAYLDYPDGSIQAIVNTSQQPLTYLIVLPSALSIYSLSFTIYRSSWRWTAASTALFLAVVSWLLAGLSGIVNATIAFQETIHNTLWIVGHFHHMAVAMIGLVVFGAIYAFLPELVGRPLWSERLGIWHVSLTFLLVTTNSALWLWQGLEGAPRRFSILPEGYYSLAVAGVPVVLVLAAVQVIFVVNVVQTMRGAGAPAPDDPWRRRRPDADVEAVIVLSVLAVVAVAGAAALLLARGGGEEAGTGGAGAPPAQTEPAPGGEDAAARELFASQCAGCHTLSAAGATGTIGPTLDGTALGEEEIARIVREGRGGMPAFAGRLTDEEIEALARFVAGAGR